MGIYRVLGFPKMRHILGGPTNKNYNIVESRSGSPYSG